MTHARPHLIALIAAFALAALLFAPRASAQDTKWNVGSGSFHNAANWSDGVPDANTNALFFGKVGTVDFTANAATNLLGVVSESNMTFALGGHTYAVSLLDVSLNSALTLQNGTFSATTATVSGIAFGPSTLTVGNGATFQVGVGGLIVGTSGEANFVIANGGMAEAQSLLVSTTAGGSGFVNVQQGGTLTTGSATLGLVGGTDAKANVAGSWTNNTSMILGSAGLAELNIGHDGMASTGTGGSVTTLSLTIGAAAGGDGTVNLGEDAMLTSTIATVASAAGSTGAVNIGDGGTWTNNGLLTVGALAGTGGDGAVDVSAGGLLRTQDLTVGNGATVTQTGTGAIITAIPTVNLGDLGPAIQALIDDGGLFVSNNSLSIVNGGTLQATRGFISSFTPGNGVTAAATVNGVDSLLDLDGGDLVVGGFGNGALTISGGGKVESGDGMIGESSGVTGSVTVTGTGPDPGSEPSEWEITGSLTVGEEGDGTLTVSGGALVSATGAVAVGAAGGSGEVLVTGANSLLDIGGDLTLGADVMLGNAADLDDVTAVLTVGSGGAVVVNGGAGTVFINESGTLAGADGTIDGSVQLFGHLAPGASIGTLTVTGDLETHAGSVIHVEYNDDPIDVMAVLGLDPDALPAGVVVLLSDLLVVEGQATLADGTVIEIVKLTGGAGQGDSIIIVHAGAGGMDPMNPPDLEIEGAFLFNWLVDVIEDNGDQFLLLTAQFDEDEFDDFLDTLSGNLLRVAEALGEGELFAILGALDPADPETGLLTLLPLQHGAATAQQVRSSQLLNNSFLGQMAAGRAGIRAAAGGHVPGMFSGSATDPEAIAQVVRSLNKRGDADAALGLLQDENSRWGGFFQGLGVWERVDSDGADRAGHRARVFGGHVGIHNHLSPDCLLGISFAYLNTDLTFRQDLGEGEIHTFRVGPYLSWSPGGGDFFIDASGTYGYHRNEIDRNVLVPVPGTAVGRYDAHDISIVGLAGYDFRIFEGTMITPMIGAEYTHLRTDSFRERGSAANLSVDSQTTDSLRVRAGAKLAQAIVIGEHTIVPEIYGGWAHEFLDTDIDLRSRFLAGGPSFTTRTAGTGRGSLQVGGGLTAMAGTYITLYVRYEGEFQSDRRSHGVIGGLNINF